METLTKTKRNFLRILPVLLILSTASVFRQAARWFGNDVGYLTGFGFYWIWCWSVPLILWGKGGIKKVFTSDVSLFRKENWLVTLVLCLTILGAVWMYFIPNLSRVSLWIVLFSPVAILNGTSEEILWRGVYVKAFGNNPIGARIYPALGFAISHISPLQIVPARTGTIPFLFSAFFLGLAFGWVAYKTKSAKWTAITHSLMGLLAFGEPISVVLARLVLS